MSVFQEQNHQNITFQVDWFGPQILNMIYKIYQTLFLVTLGDMTVCSTSDVSIHWMVDMELDSGLSHFPTNQNLKIRTVFFCRCIIPPFVLQPKHKYMYHRIIKIERLTSRNIEYKQ